MAIAKRFTLQTNTIKKLEWQLRIFSRYTQMQKIKFEPNIPLHNSKLGPLISLSILLSLHLLQERHSVKFLADPYQAHVTLYFSTFQYFAVNTA